MSEGQSPAQPLPQSQGGGEGDPTTQPPALDPSAPAPTHPLDRGGVVPDEPTTPAAPPAVESCELFTPEGLASHSHGSSVRATMGPVGGGVPSPNVTSARNTDPAPAPERNTERARPTGPQNGAGQDRTTTEPDDGHPPHPGTSDGEETDPGPEGGTSRNTGHDLSQHSYLVTCSGPWCRESYEWTGPAPRDAGLEAIVPRVVRALAAADWRLVSPDPMDGITALCPEHNPYGREFKEAVRQVLREDQHETSRRAIMRELDRFSAPWFPPPPPRRPWYDDTQERRAREALANHPPVDSAQEPDDDHTSDGRCKYPATCILENRHPVDSAQEPPPNVQPGLVGSDHSGITPHYVAGDTNQNERPRHRWWHRWRLWPWCEICQERAPRGHK